jgi:hypothetical protein
MIETTGLLSILLFVRFFVGGMLLIVMPSGDLLPG